MEAESVSEGVNAVIYKDSNSGDVAYWQLDNEWNYETGYIANDKQKFSLETFFNVDLTGDSIIGLDKNKDGFFNDSDLTGVPIEDKGSVSMLTDLGNQLYVGSYSNEISFFGNHSKSNELSSVGWEILGVDTGVNATTVH